MSRFSLAGLGRNTLLIIGAFIIGALVMAGLGALLLNIQERRSEALEFPLQVVPIAENELDPAVWGNNFPREYDSFKRTQDDTVRTKYGGSVPYDKLEVYPALRKLYSGYAFAEEYNAARGHYWALIDQKETRRQEVVKQPGACANCHAAEAPQLIREMGWENFNRTPYADIADKLHLGTSCADCHDPDTMALRITRPAFENAMAARGVDWRQASRQEMRIYVCAQCHVEYYFAGENKVLTFPWTQGFKVEEIEAYYDQLGFTDWKHKEAGSPLLKMQHPEFELFSTSLHFNSGVTCADCHMPYVREGAVKVSDHWLRSPITNIAKACQTCHRQSEEELVERIYTIQDRTVDLTQRAGQALSDAVDAIAAAQAAGATEEQLASARNLHRRGQMRWDFVSSENSTGFHSPQEAARILGEAIDYGRQAQVQAERVNPSR
jgi:nitrite reductase (cytochrome c-552)